MATPKKTVKAAHVETVKAEAVLANVQTVTAEGALKKLAALSIENNNAIAKLSAQMTNELATLDNVKQSIELKRAELKNLHDIEVTSNTLDQLNAEIENTRREHEEEEEKLAVTREREQEQYGYDLKMKRRDDDERHSLKLKEKDRAMLEREIALSTRETAIATKEKEIAEFPAKLDAAIKAARAEGIGIAKGQADAAARLVETTHDAQKSILVSQIEHLKHSLQETSLRLTAMQEQLNRAHQDNKDLANKIADVSAGKDVIASMQKTIEAQQSAPNAARKN